MTLRPESAQQEHDAEQEEIRLYNLGKSRQQQPSPQEQAEQQSMAEQMAAAYNNHQSKGSTTSSEPALSPQSPTAPTIPSKGDQLLRNLQRTSTPVVNEP